MERDLRDWDGWTRLYFLRWTPALIGRYYHSFWMCVRAKTETKKDQIWYHFYSEDSFNEMTTKNKWWAWYDRYIAEWNRLVEISADESFRKLAKEAWLHYGPVHDPSEFFVGRLRNEE